MIEKTMDMTWDEAYQDYELEDLLIEACDTYEKMGQLFTELLSYYAGKYDDKAMKLLDEMMGQYILDTM
jgi:hypothetical protein